MKKSKILKSECYNRINTEVVDVCLHFHSSSHIPTHLTALLFEPILWKVSVFLSLDLREDSEGH